MYAMPNPKYADESANVGRRRGEVYVQDEQERKRIHDWKYHGHDNSYKECGTTIAHTERRFRLARIFVFDKRSLTS